MRRSFRLRTMLPKAALNVSPNNRCRPSAGRSSAGRSARARRSRKNVRASAVLSTEAGSFQPARASNDRIPWGGERTLRCPSAAQGTGKRTGVSDPAITSWKAKRPPGRSTRASAAKSWAFVAMFTVACWLHATSKEWSGDGSSRTSAFRNGREPAGWAPVRAASGARNRRSAHPVVRSPPRPARARSRCRLGRGPPTFVRLRRFLRPRPWRCRALQSARSPPPGRRPPG